MLLCRRQLQLPLTHNHHQGNHLHCVINTEEALQSGDSTGEFTMAPFSSSINRPRIATSCSSCCIQHRNYQDFQPPLESLLPTSVHLITSLNDPLFPHQTLSQCCQFCIYEYIFVACIAYIKYSARVVILTVSKFAYNK